MARGREMSPDPTTAVIRLKILPFIDPGLNFDKRNFIGFETN